MNRHPLAATLALAVGLAALAALAAPAVAAEPSRDTGVGPVIAAQGNLALVRIRQEQSAAIAGTALRALQPLPAAAAPVLLRVGAPAQRTRNTRSASAW
jgi:hypothetical protein